MLPLLSRLLQLLERFDAARILLEGYIILAHRGEGCLYGVIQPCWCQVLPPRGDHARKAVQLSLRKQFLQNKEKDVRACMSRHDPDNFCFAWRKYSKDVCGH